ncbi:hypothetical protein B0T10DRAFT_537075 [Thelonectria olida]|uniref:Uncharacterized protein n=1 Tax=Thelonectria olida TaxID=1576542 RepID=A0A9P8W8X4_9HYPO|nr:hypothetical protein B0T10DRAFT_537075 [Thelonectria olida]
MQSTAQDYELAERLSECEPLDTNGPADSSTQAPQRLSGVQYVSLSIQILLTIFPVLFIALAMVAGRMVQDAISLSPTIFPIMFAAIVGKFFRALGLFGAERGMKLGTLERLIESQPLFTNAERQVALRGQYLLGIFMIFLWVLSPLGGQSALRLLHEVPTVVSAHATLRYLPKEATLRQDLFRNVRIPSLDSLNHVPYSSLLGIPVVGIPTTGNLSFNLISRYLAINCYSAIHIANSSMFKNTSTGEGPGYAESELGATFRVELEFPDLALRNTTLPPFTMTSQNEINLTDVNSVNCSIAPQDVESSIFCTDQSCQVTSIRNITVDLKLWYDNYSGVVRPSFSYFATTTTESSSLTEMRVQDPDAKFSAETLGIFANLSQLPLPKLSRNLELVYNTFCTNSSLYDDISNETARPFPMPVLDFNSSQTTTTRNSGKEYVFSRIFVSFLLLISSLLILASMITLILMKMTLAPDVLGYMSSYTKDNTFITLDQGSYLGGLERARARKDLRVILGGVDAGSEVRHVAFATAARAQKLRKDRLYN